MPSASVSSLLETIEQISKLPHLKGIIMGTKGIGKGLDDDALEPVWEALTKTGLVVFLHPHYGVDSSAWGEKENGHVLPLALGFPFETTTVSLILNSLITQLNSHDTLTGDRSSNPHRRIRPPPNPPHSPGPLWWYPTPPLLPPRIMHRTRPSRRLPPQT